MLQSVSYVVSLTTVTLQCRKPSSAATFSDSCCAEGNDKTDSLYFKYLMPLMAIYCQADHTPQIKTNFLCLSYEQIFVHMLFWGEGRKTAKEREKKGERFT
jgi:hypothetical protein